jgi:hypothetical protein
VIGMDAGKVIYNQKMKCLECYVKKFQAKREILIVKKQMWE